MLTETVRVVAVPVAARMCAARRPADADAASAASAALGP